MKLLWHLPSAPHLGFFGFWACFSYQAGEKEAASAKQHLSCCCPIKTRHEQGKLLKFCLKADEETTLQILALSLFPYPSLAGEFGKCQRSPWILQAMERFYISPGLTVSADSSHMIGTDWQNV